MADPTAIAPVRQRTDMPIRYLAPATPHFPPESPASGMAAMEFLRCSFASSTGPSLARGEDTLVLYMGVARDRIVAAS